VPTGSGGARNFSAAVDDKTDFLATVVGELDEHNFRFGGTGVKRAVKLWNSNAEHKEEIKLTTARRWLREAGFTSLVPQVGPFIKVINIDQREVFFHCHWRHTPQWWCQVVFTDSTEVDSEHVPNPRNERQYCRAGERPRPLKKKEVQIEKFTHTGPVPNMVWWAPFIFMELSTPMCISLGYSPNLSVEFVNYSMITMIKAVGHFNRVTKNL